MPPLTVTVPLPVPLPASVVPVPSHYGASVGGDSQIRGDSQFAEVDLDLEFAQQGGEGAHGESFGGREPVL